MAIVDIERGLAFVHVPRCAGVSITMALKPHLSPHCLIDLITRHRYGWELASRFGAHWDHLYRFAVLRDPFEIIESDYWLTRSSLAEVRASGLWSRLEPPWRDRLRRMQPDLSFERFVREEYLGRYSGVHRPGFWATYCRSRRNGDLGIEPIPFADLADRWPRLVARLGLPPVELPHLNSEHPGASIPWPTALRAAILDYCAEDLRVLRRCS